MPGWRRPVKFCGVTANFNGDAFNIASLGHMSLTLLSQMRPYPPGSPTGIQELWADNLKQLNKPQKK